MDYFTTILRENKKLTPEIIRETQLELNKLFKEMEEDDKVWYGRKWIIR